MGLHCRRQAYQLGESLLMDGSSLLEGEGLIAVGLRTEKRTHLVEQATEARSSGAVFEPAHRPIPLFDPSMILLQMVIQVEIGTQPWGTKPPGYMHGTTIAAPVLRARLLD